MRPAPSTHTYVHGYNDREQKRLMDQAMSLTELLHWDTRYAAGSLILEAGCGVGAQTVTLAQNNPESNFVSIDISDASLRLAQERLSTAGVKNVKLQKTDIFNLPFELQAFDHLFLCFVLEHLPNPREALRKLLQHLKPDGTVTVIEGDHGSTFFHPESTAARRAIQCLVELQKRAGGNSLIGRELFPILTDAGCRDVRISPRFVYVDESMPHLVEGFTRNTFTAMVEGVRTQVIAAGLMSEAEFDQGIRDLHRTEEPDGTFCYTFFKAVGIK